MPINPFVVGCLVWLSLLKTFSELLRRLVPVFPTSRFFYVRYRRDFTSYEIQGGVLLSVLGPSKLFCFDVPSFLSSSSPTTNHIRCFLLSTNHTIISTNDSQITFKDIIIQHSSLLSTEFTQQQHQPSVLARSDSSPSR